MAIEENVNEEMKKKTMKKMSESEEKCNNVRPIEENGERNENEM